MGTDTAGRLQVCVGVGGTDWGGGGELPVFVKKTFLDLGPVVQN